MNAFWTAVLEDILANLITTLLIAMGVVGFWLWRFTGREQRVRQWIPPERRVFRVSATEPTNWLVHATSFVSILRPDETLRLIDWHSQRLHRRPHNGHVVRVEGIDPWRFSTVNFYDFLTTNLTAFPANWPRPTGRGWYSTWIHWRSVFPLIRRIREVIGTPQSGEEALMNSHLANPLAISFLIQDATGRWGVVARSQWVAVSAGQWGATVAGTVTPEDLTQFPEHPIAVCARREAQEELNLIIDTIAWDGLVISRQKMQPVALVSARIARRWEDVMPLIAQARDWSFENTALYAIPPESIASVIRQAPLTDAAAYHLSLHIPSHRSILRRIPLNRYRISAGPIKNNPSDS
ncbi:hypothetical protein [Sulfobacillus thermosulfidooxidans]|uniref:hypothetical protein n=1 Tax=Sulfobacillus thermosulfidooxidans TaxID=28034 RepID=UPI00030B9E43|nr:hypothetical protein [Sulfobacillus thermosulfidooxidans]